MASHTLIVGGGVFGFTTALSLEARGHTVTVVDPGPIPHPDAASTDLSKVIRLDYGADLAYTTLCERAREGWLRWNEELGEILYHEVGLLLITQEPFSPGGFEQESFTLLSARGHPLERLQRADLARRFPAWNDAVYSDGYLNPHSGFAESGRVVASLARQAALHGIRIVTGEACVAFVEEGDRVRGIRTASGRRLLADDTVVAAGAWTCELLPELAGALRSVGVPVFHLAPDDVEPFTPPRFPVFCADVTRTGWYGFPVHPREGVVKIARHGAGRPIRASRDERFVTSEETRDLRAFLDEALPALKDAPIVRTRLCLYCDTLDGDFWIDRHPGRPGMTVAAGGSGHAFKFAPVLGDLVADAVEGESNPFLDPFRWRDVPETEIGHDVARWGENR